MNHVGLGANVVEENTSFNTYRDEAGVQLDGSTGRYELTFVTTPPVNFFWSVTLYLADTGHVFTNGLNRYSISGSASKARAGRRLIVQAEAPADPVDHESWLPAPRDEFFLVLRAYGPREELLDGRWAPAASNGSTRPLTDEQDECRCLGGHRVRLRPPKGDDDLSALVRVHAWGYPLVSLPGCDRT